jgi:hypothetical protein
MDLANIGCVVYGQDDPAQHHVANILFNLRRQPGSGGGVLPIRATFLPMWDRLATACRAFVAAVPAGGRTGLTSFLETVAAYEIYRDAAAALAAFQPATPANATTLRAARDFRARWRGSVRLGLVPAIG